MIRPPDFSGAAVGTAQLGDARRNADVRSRISEDLGLVDSWAWVDQVHGAVVVEAVEPGPQGEADALYTTHSGLALTIATADCVPIILEGKGVVAVVHAGWRGAAAGVVPAALAALAAAHSPADRAAIGPAIGPCCYEVGPEVVDRFPGFAATTTWDTSSIDLPGFIASQLDGLRVWSADLCTHHDERFHSYRRDGTADRQVAVGWLPT